MIAELIAKYNIEPKNGDPAISQYHGQWFRGQVVLGVNGKPFKIVWENKVGGQPHGGNFLYVGYNDPSYSWSDEKGGWLLVADVD